MTSNIHINSERLWQSLADMAKIGPGVAGGNNRQTVTDDDGEARALFAEWCKGAGLVMSVDKVGNMFMMRAGSDPDALPVYVGSHLDTVPAGGKYDGVLGVLAGLELVRTLNDNEISTRHPIVVVNWSNEEGARFHPAMLGSGVFIGKQDIAFAYAREDMDGKRFGDELRRIGWAGEEEPGNRKMQAYFELHIEQGPVLEAASKEIGVITHCQGMKRPQYTLTGKAVHTGSTPMHMRVNAGLAAARITEVVQEVAMAEQPNAVAGIGKMVYSPCSPNVLPSTVLFAIDIRTVDGDKLQRMYDTIWQRAEKICAELGVGCKVEEVGSFDPVTFAPELVNAVRSSAEALGYGHMDMVSGSGHDACWIAEVAPAAMIMCPCVDGLSHNEAEAISPEWAAAGADVLLHSVLKVAGQSNQN